MYSVRWGVVLAVLAVGCGSRTGPLVLDVDDGAPPPKDSSVDSSIDTFVPVDSGVVDSGFDSGIDSTIFDSGIDTTPPPDTFFDLPPDAVLTSLTIDPRNPTVFIDTATSPPTPGSTSFTITEHFSDGSTRDVSAFVPCKISKPSIGTLSGNVFTAAPSLPSPTYADWTSLDCSIDGLSASTTISVVQLRKTGTKRDFFFLEPFGGAPSPTRDVLRFGTAIKAVDVAFSVDTTGSMSSSIAALKSSLSTTIIPGLAKAIPDVGVSVSYHDDYPYGAHGSLGCGAGLPGDVPNGLITPITTDVPTAQAAANRLETHCGGDEPEAQIPSMFQIVTGKGLLWPGGSVAPHVPAPGTTGGVDFRPGALPVVIEITDAHWHDTSFDPYTDIPGAPTMAADLVPAMKAAGAKFVGVMDIHFSTPEDQENTLSDATDSHVDPSAFGGSCGAGMCCTLAGGAGRPPTGPAGSCRLNFQVNNGVGLGDSIVTAISAISVGTIFDVTAVASNDPSNPGGVDATKFIKALRAMDEGSAPDGCAPRTAIDTNGDGVKDTFPSTVVGTPVCFEVLPAINTSVPPTSAPQFFDAFIDVIGNPGAVKLDRRTAIFEVPPATPI